MTEVIAVEQQLPAVVNGEMPAEHITVDAPAPSASVVISGEEPIAIANGTNGTATANGDKKLKKEKEKKEKERKEKTPEPAKEPPKSLKEDPADWAKNHQGLASRKANYDVLAKVIAHVEEDESKRVKLPGKPDSVTSSQFVAAFSDGQLAAQAVKKLSILAAVPIVEGEEETKKKENQVALLQALADYAKSESGVTEEKLFAPADVQEGKKSAYPALFSTLITVLDNKGVVDADQLASDAVKYAEENSLTGKAKNALSQITHSISSLKLSLVGDLYSFTRAFITCHHLYHELFQQKKKSSTDGGEINEAAPAGDKVENGVANGENGVPESSNAPNGGTYIDKKETEGQAS